MADSTTPIDRRMSDDPASRSDVTQAYHLWDELFAMGLAMALSTSGGDPEEKEQAWQRLIRGQERSLAERDEMLVRLATTWKGYPHGA